MPVLVSGVCAAAGVLTKSETPIMNKTHHVDFREVIAVLLLWNFVRG
jgi:hypothetical protein